MDDGVRYVVATVLQELPEELDADALALVGRSRPSPELQRLGYLLDVVGNGRLADPLLRVLSERRTRPVPLSPGGPRVDGTSRPWKIIPNEVVEVDE